MSERKYHLVVTLRKVAELEMEKKKHIKTKPRFSNVKEALQFGDELDLKEMKIFVKVLKSS